MNDKVRYDGSPRVVYAESVLAEAGFRARVVLPITDPYVKHHGSLGSFATVYLSEEDRADPQRRLAAMAALRECPGVYQVFGREDAAHHFELPADRIGDLVVLGDQNTVIGRTPEFHDLSQVPHLRSHGGLDENEVPLWINRTLTPDYSKLLTSGRGRNFHLFDFLLNGVIP